MSTQNRDDTLGAIAKSRIDVLTEQMRDFQQRTRSAAFQTLEDLIYQWLLGEIKFVSTGRIRVCGDPSATLERTVGDGFSVSELQDLGEQSVDEALVNLHDVITDLVYLTMKGAIAPQNVTYQPPGYTGIQGILDKEAILRQFPDLREVPNICCDKEEFVGILAIDLAVLVIDAIRFDV